MKKSVLKNFQILQENAWPAALLKRLQHRCFPVKFAKFLRTPILKNICKWLLLSKVVCILFTKNHSIAVSLKHYCHFLTFPSPHPVPSSTIPSPTCSLLVIIAPLKHKTNHSKIFKELFFCQILLSRGVFRNNPNNYDGAFLRK